jgi:hypothetical protein
LGERFGLKRISVWGWRREVAVERDSFSKIVAIPKA